MSSYTHVGHLYRRGQTVFLALCLLACTSNDPTNAWRLGAPSEQQPVAPASVTNLPGCATVTVAVSGSDKVTAHFPADSGCQTGLVLIPGGPATYDRPNSGRLTLPIRVLNRSGAGIRSPARATLGADSAVVLFPSGLALNGKRGVTAVAVDSTTPDGAAWLVGAPGITNGTDSTAPRQLTFSWVDGVQSARLSFALIAEPSDTSRPVVPAMFTYPMDSLYLVQNPTDTQWIYLRRFAIVAFKKTVAGITVRQFFVRHHMIVVGGLKALGDYVVQFPDPGASWSAYSAFVDSLNIDPAVRYITPVAWRGAKPVKRAFNVTAEPADTGRPIRPDTSSYPVDSLHLVRNPVDSEWIYLRRYAIVRFKDSASGLSIRQVLSHWGAVIVGGEPTIDAYVVQLPDSGPTWLPFYKRIHAIDSDPAVAFAAPISWSTPNPPMFGLHSMADTARPTLPTTFTYPTDSLRLVQDPIDTVLIYMRRYALIGFRASATGLQVRSVLSRWGATIVGGMPSSGSYVVTLPDTATTWVSFLGRMKAIERDRSVAFTYPIAWRAGGPVTFRRRCEHPCPPVSRPHR